MKIYMRNIHSKELEVARTVDAMEELVKVLSLHDSSDAKIVKAAKAFFDAYCMATIMGCEKECFNAMAIFPPDVLPF